MGVLLDHKTALGNRTVMLKVTENAFSGIPIHRAVSSTAYGYDAVFRSLEI